MYGLLQQLRVRTNNLFAAEATDASGFQTDMFNRTGYIIKDDEIADLEGLIETNRQRSEDIAQNGLYRQGNSNTAHAEACYQCGNIHADVRQDGEQHHRPDEHAQNHTKND